ncbi:MAG: CGLD27 family protein [Leptolyngbyaceae cyanobacterium SM1_1_3]|nr:CGLD27 family protein [Leptolyngbyaceae cyanobacterium SM1_1_3]NJN03572.1 CGLD27 family protein [Leptolyngbyaceae cyanobacterium RM1_1_2]NJO11379.1 CGLD27 family protein [Leptolyngbyaceae cyanobacterium SL_1_1]
MKSRSTRCPVPSEQQPINEYQDIRGSWFYSWAVRDLQGFILPILILWLVSWTISGPVSAASFPPSKALLKFLLSSAAGAVLLPVLALLQLYVGWIHVGNRLKAKTVPYEESGWYDGQVWLKPDEVASRDRLIVDYQVQPLLKRIQASLGILASCLLAGGLIWQFV